MKTSHFFITAAAILAGIGMNVFPASAACTYAPAGMVSWWKAENNADDMSGNHHGTLQGGLGFGAGPRVEKDEDNYSEAEATEKTE